MRAAGHPGRHHQLLGTQRDLAAVPLDLEDPLAAAGVVARPRRRRGAPVVQLHHPRVHLEPVGDLVLGREHRPMVGKRDVRQVVVPDRVVQAERLVALAPRVTGTLVTLDDDGRHAELAQARAERDPALSAADDHDLRLDLVADPLGLDAAPFEPGEAVAVGAVLDAVRPRGAARLLVALELAQRGEQRPRIAVPQPQVPVAATGLGLERDPRLRHALGLGGRLGGREPARPRRGERVVEQVLHALGAFDRLDVPGERDEVAPEAGLQEQLRCGLGVAAREGLLEARQPLVDLGGGLHDGAGHLSSSPCS